MKLQSGKVLEVDEEDVEKVIFLKKCNHNDIKLMHTLIG